MAETPRPPQERQFVRQKGERELAPKEIDPVERTINREREFHGLLIVPLREAAEIIKNNPPDSEVVKQAEAKINEMLVSDVQPDPNNPIRMREMNKAREIFLSYIDYHRRTKFYMDMKPGTRMLAVTVPGDEVWSNKSLNDNFGQFPTDVIINRRQEITRGALGQTGYLSVMGQDSSLSLLGITDGYVRVRGAEEVQLIQGEPIPQVINDDVKEKMKMVEENMNLLITNMSHAKSSKREFMSVRYPGTGKLVLIGVDDYQRVVDQYPTMQGLSEQVKASDPEAILEVLPDYDMRLFSSYKMASGFSEVPPNASEDRGNLINRKQAETMSRIAASISEIKGGYVNEFEPGDYYEILEEIRKKQEEIMALGNSVVDQYGVHHKIFKVVAEGDRTYYEVDKVVIQGIRKGSLKAQEVGSQNFENLVRSNSEMEQSFTSDQKRDMGIKDQVRSGVERYVPENGKKIVDLLHEYKKYINIIDTVVYNTREELEGKEKVSFLGSEEEHIVYDIHRKNYNITKKLKNQQALRGRDITWASEVLSTDVRDYNFSNRADFFQKSLEISNSEKTKESKFLVAVDFQNVGPELLRSYERKLQEMLYMVEEYKQDNGKVPNELTPEMLDILSGVGDEVTIMLREKRAEILDVFTQKFNIDMRESNVGVYIGGDEIFFNIPEDVLTKIGYQSMINTIRGSARSRIPSYDEFIQEPGRIPKLLDMGKAAIVEEIKAVGGNRLVSTQYEIKKGEDELNKAELVKHYGGLEKGVDYAKQIEKYMEILLHNIRGSIQNSRLLDRYSETIDKDLENVINSWGLADFHVEYVKKENEEGGLKIFSHISDPLGSYQRIEWTKESLEKSLRDRQVKLEPWLIEKIFEKAA